jgi:hypothetical protein
MDRRAEALFIVSTNVVPSGVEESLISLQCPGQLIDRDVSTSLDMTEVVIASRNQNVCWTLRRCVRGQK